MAPISSSGTSGAVGRPLPAAAAARRPGRLPGGQHACPAAWSDRVPPLGGQLLADRLCTTCGCGRTGGAPACRRSCMRRLGPGDSSLDRVLRSRRRRRPAVRRCAGRSAGPARRAPWRTRLPAGSATPAPARSTTRRMTGASTAFALAGSSLLRRPRRSQRPGQGGPVAARTSADASPPLRPPRKSSAVVRACSAVHRCLRLRRDSRCRCWRPARCLRTFLQAAAPACDTIDSSSWCVAAASEAPAALGRRSPSTRGPPGAGRGPRRCPCRNPVHVCVAAGESIAWIPAGRSWAGLRDGCCCSDYRNIL
jgi:hypothetical protein